MKIQVSKKNIEEAVRRDSHHCMIADAIKEHIPEAQYILVDAQSIRFSIRKENTRKAYFTPLIAQRNLIKFDQGEEVKPFEITLNKLADERPMGWAHQKFPGETKRKNGSRKYKKTIKKNSKRRLVVAYKERAYGLRNIPE